MSALKENNKSTSTSPKRQKNEIVGRKSRLPARDLTTPVALMGRFAEEMGRLFQEFGMNPGMPMPGLLITAPELFGGEADEWAADWSPRIEIKPGDGKLVVRAELPGLSKDDIKVDVSPDSITIT